jgi:hypothetical protein
MTPLFILSGGRSGSTLLQRLFNTHPNAFIYGEHNGFLRPLCQSFRLLELYSKMSEKHGALIREKQDVSETFIAWARPFDQPEYIAKLRILISELYKIDELPKNSVWGFKEIR